MDLNVPYDEITLRMSLMSASGKLETTMKDLGEEGYNKLMTEVSSEIGEGPKTKDELNTVVAASNGISVSDLVASPNYQKLVDEYAYDKVKMVIEKLKSKVPTLSDREAWAILLAPQLVQ